MSWSTISGRARISVRFASLILLLVMCVFPYSAIACSCAGSDLQGLYNASPNVFTAVVTGARYDEDGNIEADFEITESFKGTAPFDKLRTRRGGTSCDTSIAVGPEYLFFIGDDGSFGMCSGNRTLQPGKPTPWLDILRAFTAGTTSDLSSSWTYYQHDGRCLLRTDFRATSVAIMSSLSIEYRYATPENPVRAVDHRGKIGYARATFMLPTRGEPAGAQLVLKTSNQQFIARWSDDALPGRSRGAFQLSGEDAGAFAEELLVSSEVEIEGSLSRYPTLDGTVIRTTNAGRAISDFVHCASQHQFRDAQRN